MYSLFLDDERQPWDVTWVNYVIDRRPWVIVRNYDQFIDHINEFGCPNFVSFDHDLADFHYEAMIKENSIDNTFNMFSNLLQAVVGEQPSSISTNVDYGIEKTGYDCMKWLVDYCVDNQLKFPDHVIHSMNRIAGERMKAYIINAKKHLNI